MHCLGRRAVRGSGLLFAAALGLPTQKSPEKCLFFSTGQLRSSSAPSVPQADCQPSSKGCVRRIPQADWAHGLAVVPRIFTESHIQATLKVLTTVLSLRGPNKTVSAPILSAAAEGIQSLDGSTLTSPSTGSRERKAQRKCRRETAEWKQQAPGRYHLQLLHTALDAALLKQLEGQLWSLAAEACGRDPTLESPDSMQLTEVQLVASHPGCEAQSWHVDNSLGGVTLLVPLHDTPRELGPTECLPGTHRAFEAPPHSKNATPSTMQTAVNLFHSSTRAHDSTHGSILQPPLACGDVLVMDARTVHRGARNLSKHGQPRYALIFRYDEWGAHPQTAQGPLRVLMVAQMGKWLAGRKSAACEG